MSNPIFQHAFVAYAQQLYGYAFRTLGDADRAKEIVGESFLTLVRRGADLQDMAAAKAYLFKTARFHMLNERRNRWGEMEAFVEQEDAGQAPADMGTTQAVRQALACLPEELSTPLLLKEYHGFTYEEIAEMLEVPVGTVRSRLFRARTSLMTSLKKDGGRK